MLDFTAEVNKLYDTVHFLSVLHRNTHIRWNYVGVTLGMVRTNPALHSVDMVIIVQMYCGVIV